MDITIHRYSHEQAEGDLSLQDLKDIFGIMLDEGLVEVFFHDGAVHTLDDFIGFVTADTIWFHAAFHEGEWIGFGTLNNLTSSENTAIAHLCSFACGRKTGTFDRAAIKWFSMHHVQHGIDTMIAIAPHCYRGLRRWMEAMGYVHRMRLSNALTLHRANGNRTTDADVYQLDLSETHKR